MDKAEQYLVNYISYLKDIKKFSANTIKAYQQDIAQFFKHMEKEELLVDREGIRDYISKIFIQSRNKSTVARKIYALKSFYSFVLKNGGIEKNPFDGINTPKIDRKIPEILTISEMNKFLDRLPKNNFIELRNKAIFELLYATGMRISELTNLKLTDIDFENRLLRVMGKGKKERIVPFNETARDALLRFNRESKLKFKITKEYVFVNNRGNKITDRSVERILQESFKQVMDSDKHVYPHLFRHSFATHLLQKGANLRVIQELLGHSNLATTEKYTTLNFSDLLKVYRQYHPREQQ
ncbi:MAG: tyrosine recombinase XerC [Candidatus Aminicenantes bacterium]|nr:tyrosine recombinase XerC [Candidatus Aminicenantes bacterium]